MSLYLGENKIADNTCSRNIGEIIQSTIPLTDAGLHLLDGALISSAGSYAKFVNYIAGLVSNYPDLFTTEANWQSSVTTYGVCGKFVYDSTNNTVRLPKITGFTEGTTDVTALGDLIEAGLPNIIGSFNGRGNGNGDSGWGGALVNHGTGAFNVSYQTATNSANGVAESNKTVKYDTATFNASNSNPIYGNSTTVQPQSIKILYYIVIASSITNELNLDVADMADKDFSNITSTGTSLASGWSMPSSRYIDLTLGASGSSYTAPANGWFAVKGSTTGSGGFIEIDNDKVASVCHTPSANGAFVFMPVSKNQSISIFYNQFSLTNIHFIYAEGEQ